MIETIALSAGYAKAVNLENLTARFDDGNITAVIGPNGSGKSALLRAVAGLCEIKTGGVFIDGHDRREITEKESARLLSYLPQSRPTPPFTVAETVLHGRFSRLSYPRVYREADREAAEKAMQRVGIFELRDRRVGDISGGERQKAYIAMAIAGECKNLLLDEPTAGLDISSRRELFSILRELRGEGKTIVVVIHEPADAFALADDLLLLSKGKAAGFGKAESILNSGELERVFGVKRVICEGDDGKRRILFD